MNLHALKFLIFVVPVLFFGSAYELYTGINNMRQTEIALADYETQKPSAHWLKLKNCQFDLTEASYVMGSGNRIREVYIPLHAPGNNPASKVHALLATTDASTIDLIDHMNAISAEAMPAFKSRYRKQLFQARDVEGLVKAGMGVRSDERNELSKLNANLTPDYVVIREGGKPELLAPTLIFMVSSFFILLAIRKEFFLPSGRATPRQPLG